MSALYYKIFYFINCTRATAMRTKNKTAWKASHEVDAHAYLLSLSGLSTKNVREKKKKKEIGDER